MKSCVNDAGTWVYIGEADDPATYSAESPGRLCAGQKIEPWTNQSGTETRADSSKHDSVYIYTKPYTNNIKTPKVSPGFDARTLRQKH